jgi:hypothetical protein
MGRVGGHVATRSPSPNLFHDLERRKADRDPRQHLLTSAPDHYSGIKPKEDSEQHACSAPESEEQLTSSNGIVPGPGCP